MANCPKCNYKLRLRDWRPECPKCGVNVVYYGIEDSLRAEADAAELEHAKSQPKYDRLKASVYGHPLSIVRLVLGLFPIIATLLPMGVISYVLPFGVHETSVNIVSVVTYIIDNGLDVDLLLSLISSPLLGTAMICWALAVVGLVLAVVIALVGDILNILSCSPKGFPRNLTMASLGMVFATLAQVAFVVMINQLNANLPGIFSGSVNFTAYIVMMIMFIAIIVVNVVYKKMNIPVKYKDVSEYLLPYNERPSTLAKLAAKEGNGEAAAATEAQ